MDLDNNWVVPVLHNGPHKKCMLDPVLKLEMRVTEPRQEPQEQLYDLKLYYDPHMDASNLVEAMTPDEVADTYFRVTPDRPMKIVQSPERRVVNEFLFDAAETDSSLNHGELILKYENSYDDISLDAKIIEKGAVSAVFERPFDIILYVFRSFADFAFWDDLARSKNRHRSKENQITRISIVTSTAIAEQLSRETGQELSPPDKGLVVLVSREIRP